MTEVNTDQMYWVTCFMFRRFRHFFGQILLLLMLVGAGAALACDATNFKTVEIPQGGPPEVRAILAAYQGLSHDAGKLIMPDGTVLPLGKVQQVSPEKRLQSATIADQFYYHYPLEFDLQPRRTPWEDPGRLRNDPFFRALYFDQKAEARNSLQEVHWTKGTRARFLMTSRHNVACQLTVAFREMEAANEDLSPFFSQVGGSFNWRVIGGTSRLSAHSFGIAVDFNTALGGYWRWSGAKPGQAVEFDNRYPQALVSAMETYGFIWGGKWHHFDGMHFEYRPELILHARLMVEK